MQLDRVVQVSDRAAQSDDGECAVEVSTGATSRPIKMRKLTTWHQRAAVVFFYRHPKLGNRSLITTSTVFGLNESKIALDGTHTLVNVLALRYGA